MKNSAILICFLVSALFLMTGGIAVADGHINVDIEEETAEFDGDEFSVDWGFCLDKEKQGDFYPVDVRVSWTVIIDCCGWTEKVEGGYERVIEEGDTNDEDCFTKTFEMDDVRLLENGLDPDCYRRCEPEILKVRLDVTVNPNHGNEDGDFEKWVK